MLQLSNYFPQYLSNQEILNELEEYNKDLDILSRRNISIQFNNKGKDHAILVMSKIFESSFKNVKIFARNFNGDISDNQLYIESLNNFLTRNTDSKIQVIFEDNPNEKSKTLSLLKKIKKETPNKVEIKKATQKQIDILRTFLVNEEKMIHFAIGDDIEKGFNKYRCETDTQNYIAILNFDDPKFCNTLLKLYSIIEKDATTIS